MKTIKDRKLFRYRFKRSPRGRTILKCERWQKDLGSARVDATEIIKEWDARAVLLSVELVGQDA